jgi:hypothetical protein
MERIRVGCYDVYGERNELTALDGARGINQSPFMYRIIGVDGREYGPFSADQVRQWVAESRANASTPALPQGAPEWKPLGSLPEFSMLFAASRAQAHPPVFSPATAPSLKTNGLALAGFILGLISCPFSVFCCCIGPMCNILAVVFSLIGLSQINRRPDVYNGKGFAIAGLILAILGLIFYFVMMALGIASSIGSDGGTHHGYRL